jgi:hypothetical protein
VRRCWLELGAREVDVLELATQQTLRRQQVERQGRLETLASELAGTRREQGLRSEDALARDRSSLEDRQLRQELKTGHAQLDAQDARTAAERQVALDAAARQVGTTQRAARQADELDDLKHGATKADLSLDARAARERKELDLEADKRQRQLGLDSERARRQADDAAYAAKLRDDQAFADHARRVALAEDLADRAETRQLDKLRAMAEIDQKIATQENEHQLKLRESLRGLDEREMIAMQATDLAKTPGGGAAWAQALAAGEAQKEREQRIATEARHASEMRDLLREQAGAMQGVMQAQLDRMEALAQRAMESAEGHQRDAGAAALHDRSLDAMSRVAASRAAPAPVVATAGELAAAGVRCKSCSAPLRADARFCAACGSAQGA